MSLSPINVAHERERFVQDLLEYMTLEEKAGQLVLVADERDSGDAGFSDQLRRGLVGGFIGANSAVRTDQLQQIAVEETRLGIPLFFAADPAQVLQGRYPEPVSAAASWNPAAIEAVQREVGAEVLAQGLNWSLAPLLSTAEYLADRGFQQSSGENPWLAAQIAAAHIRGIQSAGNGQRRRLLACLDYSSAVRSDRHSEHTAHPAECLQALLSVIRSTHPASIAIDSSERDRGAGSGEVASALLQLRRPGGYNGILLSDWARLGELSGHHMAGPGYLGLSVERLVAAVRDGSIEATDLDEAVRRVLAAKYELGLFRAGFDAGNTNGPAAPSMRDPAFDLARQSIVLLRNETGLLPLSMNSGAILVVGSAAKDRSLPLGGKVGEASSVIDGLEQLGITHKFVAGLALREGASSIDRMVHADRMAIGMAGEAARRSETVVAVCGAGSEQPEEPLGEAQRTLLETLRAANPRLILVTLGARPVDPDVGGEPLHCVLHAGLLGQHSGHAIAEILTGDHEPTGRLPYAIRTIPDEERIPFGHGLGYADFGLTDFDVELGADRVLASANLSNTSERPGSEMVQLYVRRIDGEQPQSKCVLRGFLRKQLGPRESTRVSFELSAPEFGQAGSDGRFWVEAGRYEIRLGLNARRVHAGEIVLPQPVADAMNGAGRPELQNQRSGTSGQ